MNGNRFVILLFVAIMGCLWIKFSGYLLCRIDTDGDGVGDDCELCPYDPKKLEPAICGCNVADTDVDRDLVPDCIDQCPFDAKKIHRGACGCNKEDYDSDNDGIMDCVDMCQKDHSKAMPGYCGCGVPDHDHDHDGTMDCADLCPFDETRIFPDPIIGCGPSFDNSIHKKMMKDMVSVPLWIDGLMKAGPLSKDPLSIDQIYMKDCQTDEDWYRVFEDDMCMSLWIRELLFSEIHSIDKVLGVIKDDEANKTVEMGLQHLKESQNGGFRCLFEDKEFYGYFKVCWGNTGSVESYLMEIVVFLIDRIVGYHRTPPVVPRSFKSSLLTSFSKAGDTQTNLAMASIIENCSDNDGDIVYGAMVGWSPKEIRQLLWSLREDESKKASRSPYIARFDKLNETDLLNNQNILKHNIYNIDLSVYGDEIEDLDTKLRFTLENSALNMFAILSGLLVKFDHNIYIQVIVEEDQYDGNVNSTEKKKVKKYYKGPPIFIDNDRANFDMSSKSMYGLYRDRGLGKICVFPKQFATKVMLLKPLIKTLEDLRVGMETKEYPKDAKPSLGSILYDTIMILNGYPDKHTRAHGDLLTLQQTLIVDENLRFLSEIIESCIGRYGHGNVLFDEPWLDSANNDFFENLVYVSQFKKPDTKNQN